MIELNKIYNEDCLLTMARMADKSVDLIVTSPPYDNLRTYGGYVFDFESTAKEIHRILRVGGVCVWIVGDATVDGSETGTSFSQALYFKSLDLNIHDTMIWNKGGFSAVGALAVRYAPVFEYMFVFSKGKPSTFNPIKDRKSKHGGKEVGGTIRNADGSTKPVSKRMIVNDLGQRYNIWDVGPERQHGEDCHPAPFPEDIAEGHILSWSGSGDVVYDPFLGSGTTAVASIWLGRRWLGSEINPDYCAIAQKRIDAVLAQGNLF